MKIRFDGINKTIEISKVTMIDAQAMEIFHLDKLKDNTYRLTVSKSLIPDIERLIALQLVRKIKVEYK